MEGKGRNDGLGNIPRATTGASRSRVQLEPQGLGRYQGYNWSLKLAATAGASIFASGAPTNLNSQRYLYLLMPQKVPWYVDSYSPKVVCYEGSVANDPIWVLSWCSNNP